MTQSQKTNDYSIFKKHPNNTNINESNLKKIINSIKTQNMLEFRPIVVDSEMRVVDGQHRLEAAKMLGVDVWYQKREESTHEDIVLLNTAQRVWGTSDYVNYYISRGNTDYEMYKRYADEKGVSITTILQLSGKKSGGCHGLGKSNVIKRGELKFLTPQEKFDLDELFSKKDEVMNILKRFILSEKNCLASIKLQQSLMAFLKNPDVDLEIFKKKLTINCDSIKTCSNVYGYYCMFRDIYNWKNRNPLE